jgi:hypothetical protein
MTSDRRLRANRANALRSTGPKSVGGKRRVSRNARRHGLTTAPNAEVVARWVDEILDDPKLEDVALSREEMALVTSLAEAEARLDRARHAEARFLEDYHALDRAAAHLETRHVTEIFETILDWGPSKFRDGRWRAGEPYEASERTKVKVETKERTYASEMRRLSRYRREAECARQRALKAWVGFLRDLPEPQTWRDDHLDDEQFPETNPFPGWHRVPDPKTKPWPRVLPRMKMTDIRYSGDFGDGIPDSPVREAPLKLLL